MSFIIVLLTLSACVSISTCKQDLAAEPTSADIPSEPLEGAKQLISNKTEPLSKGTSSKGNETKTSENKTEPLSNGTSSKVNETETSENKTGPLSNSTSSKANETETSEKNQVKLDNLLPRHKRPKYDKNEAKQRALQRKNQHDTNIFSWNKVNNVPPLNIPLKNDRPAVPYQSQGFSFPPNRFGEEPLHVYPGWNGGGHLGNRRPPSSPGGRFIRPCTYPCIPGPGIISEIPSYNSSSNNTGPNILPYDERHWIGNPWGNGLPDWVGNGGNVPRPPGPSTSTRQRVLLFCVVFPCLPGQLPLPGIGSGQDGGRGRNWNNGGGHGGWAGGGGHGGWAGGGQHWDNGGKQWYGQGWNNGGQPPLDIWGNGPQPPLGPWGNGPPLVGPWGIEPPPVDPWGNGPQPPVGPWGNGPQPPVDPWGNGHQLPVGPWGNGHQPPVGPWGNGPQPPVGPWGNGHQPPVGPWGNGVWHIGAGSGGGTIGQWENLRG